MSHADVINPDMGAPGHSAPASSSPAREPSLGALTVMLSVSLWLASGSFVLAAADGGEHPARRLIIGALLVTMTALALWQRHTVWAWLRDRPWLVVPLAAVQLSAAILDGLLPSGPYAGFSMTSIALAVVVARPRTVWLTVALLDLGYAAAIVLELPPSAVVREGHLSGALGALLGYPSAALVGLGLVRVFARYLADVDPILEALRKGAPALTSALTQAIERGPAPLALPPAPSPLTSLTPTERRVVQALAGGSTPKQLAHVWGVSLTTVRTHIRHAKRKTSARTLAELSAMAAYADRQQPGDRAV